MSDHSNNHGPAGGSSGVDPMKIVNKLVSPRDNTAEAPTVFKNITDAMKQTADAVRQVGAAGLDLIPATAQIAVAVPNNIAGAITTGIDRGIVKPIDGFRARMLKTLGKPLKHTAA